MIIEISRHDFKSIASKKELDLPRRWDGIDFYASLRSLYLEYQSILSAYISSSELRKVKYVCSGIVKCIEHYHNGYPV